MDIVLFTGNECPICHDIEEAFKERFKEELDSGEADIVNLDEDETAQQFWAENELPLAPIIFIVSEGKKIITVLDPMQLLKEASAAATSGG